MKAKDTASLCLLITLAYLVLSKDYVYIPWQYLKEYGFLLSNPLTVFSYAFLHISPTHLISNLLLLVLVGVIAEEKISSKEYYAVFFSSAIIAAVVFALLVPNTILVGASAAISGVLAIAFFVDFKKTIITVLIFSLVLPPVTSVINTQVQHYYSSLVVEKQSLEEKQKTIEIEISKAVKENNTALVEKLHEEKQKIIVEKQKKEALTTAIEEGKEREKQAVVMQVVHVAGALTGVVFLLLFRKDILINIPEQFEDLLNHVFIQRKT